MDKVFEGLYIGDLESARDKALLDEHGITHVVSCIGTQYFDDINYHVINLDDSPDANIYQYLYDAVEFVDEAISQQNTVFVHCYAGISRSASVVLAYIMAIKKYKLADALSALKVSRPICQPNSGFMFQLRCFEWVLNLADDQAVFPVIYKGPIFSGHKFDFGQLDLIFDSSLDDKYNNIIVISKCIVPAFRPGLTQYKIDYFIQHNNLFYNFDVLDYLPEKESSSANNKVLILADSLDILEPIYWSLLWRANYSWTDAQSFFQENALGILPTSSKSIPFTLNYKPTPRWA